MNSTGQILQLALELIRNPEHWIKDRTAIDKDGYEVWASYDGSCAYCAMGAIWRASYILRQNAVTLQSTGCYEATKAIAVAIGSKDMSYAGVDREVTNFNDAALTTHADIVAAFESAIKVNN